ncbi:MAG: carbohydrate-binding domain-containing protein [Anaerolineae bacterium]|nr:carbohydrate-binding domain-containing protein [Anaerolineae bacterium]
MERQTTSEVDLIRLAQGGSPEAFGALYRLHLDAVYRYIYSRIGDTVEAENLTQATFLKAWRAMGANSMEGEERMKKLLVLWLVLSLMSGSGLCSSSPVEASATPQGTGSASVAANVACIMAAPVEIADPLPRSAAAETVIYLGDPIVVDGPGVVISGTTATIVAGGTFSATGTLADGMINVNVTETVELILDSAVITHASGPAIMVTEAPSVTLVLADGTSNVLSDGADSTEKGTLFSNDTLIVSGNGALAITGVYKHGIVSDDDLTIDGGTITIAAHTDGLHANDAISVQGATIDVTEANDGLESEGTLLIENSVLTLAVADDGLVSAMPLTITGSTIDVTSGVDGIESKERLTIGGGSITVAVSDDGLVAATDLAVISGTIDVITGVNGIKSEGTLVIDDGAITILVSDDGLNAATDVTINGGQIYLNAAADGVNSNGTLNVNGGLVVALGGNVPEGGFDCDQCQIAINGGIVVASGGTNSAVSNASGQRVAVISGRPVGTAMHIERDDGDDTLTFLVSKTYQSMIFTSPALLGYRTYTVYTGGTISGGTNFYGLYTGATYAGGNVWTTFNTNQVVTYVGGGGPPPPP